MSVMRLFPLALLVLLVGSLAAADAVTPDPARVSAHAKALTAIGDRSPGSDGAKAAADYLVTQLEGMGFDSVQRVRATVSVPIVYEATLTTTRGPITLIPHVPNLAALPTTGNTPITGPLLVIDDVTKIENEGAIKGSIVALPGNSDDAWTRMAALGARAVIFRNPETIDAIQLAQQYLEASVDLPRFVGAVPSSLNGTEVTLSSLVRFEERQAESLLAHIPGQSGGTMPETVVLAAGYESGGLIRGLDPAATRAWNAALLLEITRQLKEIGPKRDVLVIFHGARAEAFRGLRHALGALTDVRERRADDEVINWPNAPLADRESVRLIYDMWRADLIGNDLAAFLALPAEKQNEVELGTLLRELDYLPEDKDLFAGLNYPPDTTDQASTDVSTGYAWRLSIGLLLAIGAIACIIGSVKTGKPHPALTVVLVMIVFFIDKSLLKPPSTQSETDSTVEQEAVFKLGFRFVSEEAARRADDLQPVLESLRLVRSLSKRKTPTAEDQRKIENNLLIASRILEKPVRVEDADGLIGEISGEHRIWRDIQQKLTKRILNEQERARLPDLVRAVVTAPSKIQDANLDRHMMVLGNRRDDLMSGIKARNALGIEKSAGLDPRLLLAFDLSDGNTAYSTVAHGPLANWKNELRQLNLEIRRTAQRLNEERLDGILAYDGSPYEGGDAPNAWWPKSYTHAAAWSNWLVNSTTFSTVNDQRLKVGTPQDTAANFNSDIFLAQTQGMTALVQEIIAGGLPVAKRHKKIQMQSPLIRIETLSEGSATGTKDYPYPLVTVDLMKTERGYLRDVRMEETRRGDAFGIVRNYYTAHKIPDTGGSDYPIRVAGFEANGKIRDVVVSSGTQKAKGVDNSVLRQKGGLRDIKLQVFRAEASNLFGIFDPRLLSSLPEISILSSTRDAAPNQAHHELDAGVAALFAPPGVKLRVLASVGQVGKRMLLLGDHIKGDKFAGLEPATELSSEPVIDENQVHGERRPGPTSLAVARDTLQICKARLDILQKNGISPENIWTLLAEGQRRLEAGDAAMAEGNISAAEGLGQASWAYLSRVYPAVLQTANDVVYGLVVMLLIAIPFALICERLFVSANTIFGKIAGFAGFFVAIFLFFYMFHPAFELATTPVIIFLAFTIIVISVLVIGVIYQRFEYEMELIRMAGLGMHKADVSRLGTLLATGTLGISNMRRRPMRTFLTAITVVLMTFILLTFASFSSAAGTRKLSEPVAPTFNGVLLRMPGWLAMPDDSAKRVHNTWGQRMQTFERRWLMGQGEVLKFPLNGPEAPSYVEGLISFEFNDPSGIDEALLRPDGERGFQGETDWLFLPDVVLNQSGLKPGDSLLFRGVKLRVGQLDGDKLAGITHLGGDPITPLSATALTPEQLKELQEQAQMAASGEAPPEASNLTHLSPNSVAVAHASVARQLGGVIRSIALVPWSEQALSAQGDAAKTLIPASETDVAVVAEDMAQQLAQTLRVGDRGETYLLTGIGKLAVAGLSDVLIPLVLGGLIIFSTMLGSVAERGKEIFIYASLGLAPIHIGALFLVEASIYSVLGGIGGYMLAQFLAAFLGWMASMGIGVQPDLNYSSFTAVATILLVMATVLLSSLYPALVASRSAKPGDDTEFTVPEPDGDRMEIAFPFTVAARDMRGLLAFLKTYFDANTEASTGCFTAANAAMLTEGNLFAVTAKNWLAPFDLGISQSFKMTAEQTDVKAIYRIHISLELLSGQRNAWRRVLLPFLKDLRKQFLVWRTLDENTTDRYRAEGGDADAIARVNEREEAEKTRRLKKVESKDDDKAANEDSSDDDAPASADSAGDDKAEEGAK